jgi:putative ATPase
MTMDIFEQQSNEAAAESMPLAERMRPRHLKDFIGHHDVVGQGALLHQAILQDRIFSIIFWGPPGCGKTSLARIIAKTTKSHFAHFSAVLSGVKDIRSVIQEAREQLTLHHRRTILFVDEIHRFNKAQQDAFLYHVENGLIILIGATTENPSFEVIAPLLSRCRVITLHPLTEADQMVLLKRAVLDEQRGLGRYGLDLPDISADYLIRVSGGDARVALNNLEMAALMTMARLAPPGDGAKRLIELKDIEQAVEQKALRYDKHGDEHYNLISALHKSLRGSDPDAALYWLARMLMAGEDAMYVARRMVRFASEDIGNADPHALSISLAAMDAYRFLGIPEGELALAQAAIYLATAPKSNSIYTAFDSVKDKIRNTGTLPVPLHIRNAPTKLMKQMGYGRNYKYAHDFDHAYVFQHYLPEKLQGEYYYFPKDRGYERNIKKRVDLWRKKRSDQEKETIMNPVD